MLPHPVLRLVSSWIPEPRSGARLHRRALAVAERGRLAEADAGFEAAAEQYRREGEVAALARLRVHQLMVRASTADGLDPDALPEIVRRLNPLDRLESLTAPFEPRDARAVLSDWLLSREQVRVAQVGEETFVEDVARAA